MKPLLTISAALEAGTGLMLLVAPSMIATLLLGETLDTSVATVVARVAGAGLLSLGVACWLVRDEGAGRGAHALVAALLLYNIVATAVLVHAGLGLRLSGIGLWPTALLHLALAAWCIACLRSRSR